MNAHTPFDANKDWTNPYCQNSSNDPMVDALLGNAYHVVRTVYCNLGNLKLIYDFLNQYGMVLGVQSEAELKALTTKASFARIYDKTPAGDRQVTDYLYVEGDRTGVIPDDVTATGSWVKVATSNSSGGGGSTNDGGYIPWIYNSGSAIGGETTIRIPDETAGVPFMIVNGDWQTEGYDFEYDPLTFEVKFTTPLEQGDFVVVMRTGVPATPDSPNVSDWVTINWLYNQGAAVGGEQVIDIPFTFQSVPAVYKNGLRFYKGLANNSYTIDSDNNRIILTEPLATNDRLIVQLGGEANVLEIVDHTVQEVARAANVKDSEVILSTDTTQVLNGKKVIYDVVTQHIYGLPTLPTNVYINAVSNGQLIYSPGNVTVDLLPAPGSQDAIEVIEQSVDTINSTMDYFITPEQFGAVGDGVSDDTAKVTSSLSRRTFLKNPAYLVTDTLVVPDNVDITSKSDLVFSKTSYALQVGDNFSMRGGAIKNPNSGSALITQDKNHTTISDLSMEGSNTRTGTHAYAIVADGANNCVYERVRAKGYTGLAYILDSSHVTLRDLYTDDTVYHAHLDAGGYGVLLAGASFIDIDNLHFVVGDNGNADGYNGRHAVYVSTTAGSTECRFINITNLFADYTKRSVVPPAAINIRNSIGLKITNAQIYGSSISGIRDSGSSDMTSIDGCIVHQLKRATGTIYCINLGDDSGVNKNYNVSITNNLLRLTKYTEDVVINNNAWGVAVNGTNWKISGNTFDVDPAAYPILVKAGASNVLIEGNEDVSLSGQAFIVFEGECSNVTVVSNRLRGRAYFRNVTNVTDLTVDFPRKASVSNSAGTLTTVDTNTLISNVAFSGANVVITFNQHVTQAAIDNLHLEITSVNTAAVITSRSNKTVTVRVTDLTGTVIGISGSYSFNVHLAS